MEYYSGREVVAPSRAAESNFGGSRWGSFVSSRGSRRRRNCPLVGGHVGEQTGQEDSSRSSPSAGGGCIPPNRWRRIRHPFWSSFGRSGTGPFRVHDRFFSERWRRWLEERSRKSRARSRGEDGKDGGYHEFACRISSSPTLQLRPNLCLPEECHQFPKLPEDSWRSRNRERSVCKEEATGLQIMQGGDFGSLDPSVVAEAVKAGNPRFPAHYI